LILAALVAVLSMDKNTATNNSPINRNMERNMYKLMNPPPSLTGAATGGLRQQTIVQGF